MNIKQIIKMIASDMANVDTTINEQLHSDILLVNKLGHYILSGRGKRIRPMIVILIARALNFNSKQHITIAALIEFIHTATLLHDDVVDQSNMRRGKVSANIVFGNAASVLVGDFIYTRAFQMIIALDSLQVLTLIAEAVNAIVEGEVLQLMNCHNPDITVENYMLVISNKTAKLFEVASQSSAILADALPYQAVALRDYGRYLGTAFQLIDDLLDYGAYDNNIGKNIGDDLNEGKSTLPLLHAMENGTPVQKSLIRQVITQGNGRNFIAKILEAMQQCGSLEYTRKCAEQEANKAITCLACLSPSPYRDALADLAHLVVASNL